LQRGQLFFLMGDISPAGVAGGFSPSARVSVGARRGRKMHRSDFMGV
jgi:hypothetical protein